MTKLSNKLKVPLFLTHSLIFGAKFFFPKIRCNNTWVSKTVLSSRKNYLANPKNGRIEKGRKDERTELKS